jgi:hypothetical protein
MATVAETKTSAREAVQQANPWIETAGRAGYVAKGAVYGLIGILAFFAATGDGGKTTDKPGLIRTIAQQPFGEVLLIALGVGLLGYALYKLAMAAFNPEKNGALKRIGNAITGIVYGGIAILAFKAVMGQQTQNNNQQKAADAMAMPGGVWVVGALGLIIVGTGIMQIYKGLTGKFMEILKTEEMSEDEKKTARISGLIGLVARGIVFSVMGGFLVWAAKDHDPHKAGGIDKAMQAIAHAPYGPILLAGIGIGLVAFALFQAVEGKYRKYTPVQA